MKAGLKTVAGGTPKAIAIGLASPLLLLILLLATACAPDVSNDTSPILLFNGAGTSANDVAAIETILKNGHLSYLKVDSTLLNGMSESQLLARRLLIIPGGNYITMGRSLTPDTSAHIRNAVQGGMNYLGICAGGLIAGAGSSNHLNLTAGVRFDFYSVVNRGLHKTAVTIARPGMPALEHYWEDGPQFTGWGEVVGKYPDGTPAIVEGTSGKGWVILCGTHPEAPVKWRHGMTFTTPAGLDNAYARTLIESALNGTKLPHY